MMGNCALCKYLSLKLDLEMSLFPALVTCCITNTTDFATIVKKKFRVAAFVIENGLGAERHRGHCSDGGGEHYGGGDNDGNGDDNGDSKGDGDGGGDGDGDGNPQVGSVMVLWGLLLCYTTKVIMVFCNTSLLNTVPHVRFFQFFLQQFCSKFLTIMGNFVFCGKLKS